MQDSHLRFIRRAPEEGEKGGAGEGEGGIGGRVESARACLRNGENLK